MGYEALPVVPPGASPFDVYLDALQLQFRRGSEYGPTPGIKGRYIILFALNGFYTITVIIFAIMYLEQTLKRYGGGGIWFFRRTPVQGGVNLITTNIKAGIFIFVPLQGLVILLYLGDAWSAYIQGGSWRFVFVLRSLLPLPICLLGWLTANGALQAFIITFRNSANKFNHVQIVNWFYICGGFAFILLAGSGAIWHIVDGGRYHDQYEFFKEYLLANRASWPESFDASALAEQSSNFVERANCFRRAAIYYFSSLPFLAVLILILNASSLLLTRIIRISISENVDRLAAGEGIQVWVTSDEESNNESSSSTQRMARKAKPTEGEDPAKEIEPPSPARTTRSRSESRKSVSRAGGRSGSASSPRSPSLALPMSEIRAIALAAWDRGPDRAPWNSGGDEAERSHAQRILELQKAKVDLLLIGLAIAGMCCASLGVALYVILSLANGDYFSGSWATFEAMTTSFLWGAGLVFCPICVLLLYAQWRSRRVWKMSRQPCIEVHTQVMRSVDGPSGTEAEG